MTGIDYNTVKAAATNQWPSILAGFGVPATCLTKKHGACPACGGIDRFRFDNKAGRGTFYCNNCGAGDGFQLLQNIHEWDKKKVLGRVAEYLGIKEGIALTDRERASIERKAKSQKAAADKIERKNCIRNKKKIDEVLRGVIRINWPMAHYFRNRGLGGLSGNVPLDLKAVEALPYWSDGQLVGTFKAMVGIVRNIKGEIVTLHRTYLTDDGYKASVDEPKKLMASASLGGAAGCAIQLYKPTDKLAITEGIETALAVHLATGLPVWAAISSVLLEKVEIPTTVKEVYIMADKDKSGAGERSAKALAYRLANNHKVKIVVPKMEIEEGKKSVDWLDVYQLEQATKQPQQQGAA